MKKKKRLRSRLFSFKTKPLSKVTTVPSCSTKIIWSVSPGNNFKKLACASCSSQTEHPITILFQFVVVAACDQSRNRRAKMYNFRITQGNVKVIHNVFLTL